MVTLLNNRTITNVTDVPSTLPATEPCATSCEPVYTPVCGDNKVTYPNRCVFDITKCSSYPNLNIAYKGECRI
ncbi:Kazal-type serine protease inhibitor family protein [Endozoicomonas sp.]|uniref:Kazal-type serine protease inhibitor family protein n=1 Tax=Endozoicomonas sp. TaxID=1892382 RepID=UPI00383A97E5